MTTPSDVVGDRVRQLRKKWGMTVEQLAQRCAEEGMLELTEQALYNIEAGRRSGQGRRRGNRRAVTVDELCALARVLDVAPVHLLALPDETVQQVTRRTAVAAPEVFLWARGDRPLAGQDETRYLTESYATPAWEAFRDSLRAQAEADAERMNRVVHIDAETARQALEPVIREIASKLGLTDEVRAELNPAPDPDSDEEGGR